MAEENANLELNQEDVSNPSVIEPEITEEELQFSEFQEDKTFDLGTMPVSDSSPELMSDAQKYLETQKAQSGPSVEEQKEKKISESEFPNIERFKQEKEDLKRKQPLDEAANRLRRNLTKMLGGGDTASLNVTGGLPYRTKTLQGNFEADVPAIEQDKAAIVKNVKESLQNLIDSKGDSDKTSKQNAVDSLGAYTETIAQIPLALLVARETAINVATKDIPWFVKNVLVKLPNIAVYDTPWEDIAVNMATYVGNHGIDFLKFMTGINLTNQKGDLEDITFREFTFKNAEGKDETMPMYQHIERLDKALGVSRSIENIGKDLLKGMQVPEDQRNMLHHMIRFGIEIGTPMFLIPFGGSLRAVSKGARMLDDYNIERSVKQYIKGKKGSEQSLLDLADSYRKMLNNGDNIIKKGKLGTVVEVDGIRHTIPPYNNFVRKQAAKELGAWRYMNMTIGAGVTGGLVHGILTDMPEYKQYAPVAYLASIVGAIKGGTGLLRTTTRTPGLLSPLGGDAAGMVGYGMIGLSRTAGVLGARGILHFAGDIMRMMKKDGVAADFIDSKWGKWMQAQAAGVSVARSLRDVYTNDGQGLDKMIQEEALPEGAYKHLSEFYRSMTIPERRTMNIALRSAVKLAKSLDQMVGSKGMQEHMFMLDQVINLSVIRSQRQILMSSIKFGKEGFLAKFSGWSRLVGKRVKAGKMLSHMDQYDQIVEQQVDSLSKALKSLRKTDEVNTKGSKERIRLANIVDNYILDSLEESRKFKGVLEDYQTKAVEFSGEVGNNRFTTVLRKSQNDNGPLDEDMLPSHFKENPTPLKATQHAELDDASRIRAGTDSREIVDLAYNVAWSRNNMLYNKINDNSKFKNVNIPINNVVDSFTDDMLASAAPIIRRLSNLDPKATVDKAQFISATRMKHLNTLDFDKLLYKADEINQAVKKFEGTENSLDITYKGNSFTSTDLEDLLKKAQNEGPLGKGEDTLKDLLANLTSSKDLGNRYISGIVPSVIPLKDLRSILSGLKKKKSTKSPKEISAKTHELGDDIDTFNKAYDADSLDKSNVMDQILKDQGLSTKDIKEYLNFKKKADDNYRETIGYVWKAEVGGVLLKDPRRGAPNFPDEENLLQFFRFSENRVPGEKDIVYGVKAFNNAFPTTGTTTITRKLDSGEEVQEVVENSVLRERATKMLIHQLGIKFIYGGSKGIEFAKELKPSVIESFIQGKIIPKDIGHNLKEALKDLRTGSVKDEAIKETQNRLQRNVRDLTDLKKESTQRSWLGGLSSKGDDFNQENFVEALVFGIGKTTDVAEVAGKPIKQELVKDITTLRDISTEVGKPISKTDEALIAVDELPLKKELRDENLNIFIDLAKTKNIKDPKEAAEAIQMLDDANDLILNYGYNQSFQYSKAKAVFGEIRAKEKVGDVRAVQKEVDEVGEDAYKFHRLKMDVRQDKLAQFLNDGAETIEKLSLTKLEIAKASGDIALINAAKKDLTMLTKLREINSMAAIAKGEGSTLGVSGQPTDFVGSQIMSRVYSWARGVVGMQYLATEAAYKSWHLAHANMMKEILFNPAAVDILYKIAVQKGRMSATDSKTLSTLVLKAFSRGHAYANAQDKREGELALIARQKENIVERGIELAQYVFKFTDPNWKDKHQVSIFTDKGTIRGPKPKPAAPWTQSRPQPNTPLPNHYPR